MPIKIPEGLPAAQTLKKEKIFVMAESRATTQDIRPLRIAPQFLAQAYRMELQVQSKLQQIANLRALATQVHSFSDRKSVV